MDKAEVITHLKKVAGFFEVYHTMLFRGSRRTEAGGIQEAIVEMLDMGPNVNPDIRYSCIAKSEDGKVITGNPAESIESALLNVSWDDFGK